MGSLMSVLRNATNALKVFERGIGVVQGNVANASTPGYAKQRQLLEATSADLDRGLAGSVRSGGTLDSRNQYMDSIVRSRLQVWGETDEQVQQLQQLDQVFDIKSGSGLNGSLDRLLQAFSASATAPNDMAARQVVHDRASQLGQSFNQTAAGLAEAHSQVSRSLANNVSAINDLAAKVAGLNKQMRQDYRSQFDPGLQAQLQNTLEDLSTLVDFSMLRDETGSANIYVGGQDLLVVGDRSYPLTADVSGAQSRVLNSAGADISTQIGGGRVRAVLDLGNKSLPAHQAALDHFATTLADSVNATLFAGVDVSGNPPVQGLFTYDPALGAARTLSTSALSAGQLALADPAAPGGNAVALQVTALFRDKSIDGVTFSQYYGNMAAAAGRELSSARENQTSLKQLTNQAQSMREDLQKVNLDEEAVALLEYQRGYQAAAQMIKTLDEMTETVVNLIR